jgi:hypothetical protein
MDQWTIESYDIETAAADLVVAQPAQEGIEVGGVISAIANLE